ncbi:MAG: hypothetical protein QNJ90_04810 [Planctomycetota bacterium]|nr:hypothetical protein [Planctomycetota bacterium]
MSRNSNHPFFAFLCALAIAFAAGATGLEAQTEAPILDDDEEEMCFIQDNDTYWAVPVSLQYALEWYLQGTATVTTLGEFLNELPQATSTNAVRIEGATVSASVASELDSLGYETETTIDPTVLPGADVGVLFTQ